MPIKFTEEVANDISVKIYFSRLMSQQYAISRLEENTKPGKRKVLI